ncbi:unnamed protein product [Oppiella nova]|uniref:C2H2-type domain-containing protein n=1 Tax=Oppiella nova TaxID=334625 RepID=A0A7R9MH48_9ACAR|nr:unnamed protein product [Oppiella nova]CAG2177287.1 unnamed protein product [Oppiella nova]
MNTHTRETVYRCHWPGCEKSFVWEKSLNDHEKRHRGIPVGRFRCTHCEYRSSHESAVKRHMDSNHGMASEVVSKRTTNECNLMDRRVKRPKK